MKLLFWRRKPLPLSDWPVPDPVRVGPEKVSLHDFTVTVNTRLLREDPAHPGQYIVPLLLTDANGNSQPMQCSVQQLAWLCEDDDHFAEVWQQRQHWVDPETAAAQERKEVGAGA